RVARSAAEMGIVTVSVFSEDDSLSLHTRKTDEARGLKGSGAAAYLDIDQIVTLAKQTGCDAIHPGYGFLSENPELARACEKAGQTCGGPRAETLVLFGAKGGAREWAEKIGVPVLAGKKGGASLSEIQAFLKKHDAIMLKAVAGGGGRGMRLVQDPA